MIAIRFEHIKTVHYTVENGSTEPKFAITDDNTPVIVKTNNGPEGTLVLFNEYFCYRLAALLDIPMPHSGVCLIDDETVIYNDCVKENQFGHGFYSTYLNKAVPLVDTIIPMIKNKDDFYKTLLFDHVIFNTDRNSGNLLVQYYKNDVTLRVIDHSHVFVNQAIWDASCLVRSMVEKDYFSTRVLESNEYLYRMFFQTLPVKKEVFSDMILFFRETITERNLYDIISEMPEIWIPSEKDIKALVCYILYRIDHLDDICNTVIKYLEK